MAFLGNQLHDVFVIISAIGLILSTASSVPPYTVLLPILDLLLCFVWICFTARGFDYHRYWGVCARELEEKYLSDIVRTVSGARSFGNGSKVKLGRLSRLGGQKQVTYFVISVYMAVFVFALVYIATTL